MLHLKLVYLKEELGNSWRNDFSECENVSIISGDITKIESDAVVSPANSFGFMDGGLDWHLSERFGWHLQDELQAKIAQLEEKELLIGRSITLETKDSQIPFLISAPTMRVPMSFNIATSLNAFLAMKAILIACLNNPNINTVTIPGLCTGCGKMPFHIASNQMFLAYDEIINKNYKTYETFGDAQKYQYRLNEKGLIWDY